MSPEKNDAVKQILSLPRDVVYSIRCPTWSPEASEWIIRSRPLGWPDDRLVNKVVSYGCHFVQKSHESNPDDPTEWRFSFSMAELILIQSWSPHQIYVYHILRKVKDKVKQYCDNTKLSILTTSKRWCFGCQKNMIRVFGIKSALWQLLKCCCGKWLVGWKTHDVRIISYRVITCWIICCSTTPRVAWIWKLLA